MGRAGRREQGRGGAAEEPGSRRPHGGVGLYHVVYAHEGFQDAATKLYEILAAAIAEKPDAPRHLYLDIDGHRDDGGGYDHDMHRLLSSFIPDSLGPYLTSWSQAPDGTQRVLNANQRNDLPPNPLIRPAPEGGSTTR